MNLYYIKRPNFLASLILLNYMKIGSLFQSDVSFVMSGSGHHLTEHVISEEQTSNVMECAQFCLRKISVCKSFNYKTREKQHLSKNCQLNNATKSSQPLNFIFDPNYNYYEPLSKGKHKREVTKHAKSCDALYKSGSTRAGVYTIDPDGQGYFQVRCDMTTTPGNGWTVFQSRVDGSVDFYRNWTDYKNGFGNLEAEFWLGLDKIHRLTASGQNVLRVDLESFENETRYAHYGTFSVEDESQSYKLTIGQYQGNAHDSMKYHNGMKFTTKDRDNDEDVGRLCAVTFKGAWWYKHCHASNLNGQYLRGPQTSYADGVNWAGFKGHYYSLKTSEMKVQPGL